MALQYDNPNVPGNDSLRTQRMTADEAQSVIALWQQERVEQTGLTDRPAVPDVAEGLDIPVEEVQRLLAAVRARRLEEERALAQEQELSEIRLAEERRLAEIRRQRAELRREQLHGWRQAGRRQQVYFPPKPLLPQIGLDEFLRGFLPGFVAIAVAVMIALLLAALSYHSPPIP